eukprot:gnl/TRDRNA2_/TRDRNA2_151331_c0_seq3.p1 gnl/TRDRNA2_/TRDRNA2_151331_c0~~gnl/TRDRNA2_/TRDRNA2_151331_c0_seq3.p1  ORF type:complete len:247 (+),score=81.20 gnl/TRDRNA2_/TRDRNA2_151331_c0_seq3:62-802(+)
MNVLLLALAVSAHGALLRAPGPAPAPASDSFQDEVLDQADPEFKRLSNGGPCIGLKEMMAVYDEQVDHYSSRVGTNVATMTKDERDKLHKDAVKHAEEMFKESDTNGDGCIDEKEWNGPHEEKPAPAAKPDVKSGEAMVEGHNDKEEPIEAAAEFKLMDINGDGKVSRSEAWNYVSEYLDEADLNSEKLKQMFQKADTNKDDYLTQAEFEAAGEQYEGDGKYKFLLMPKVRSLRHALNVWKMDRPL